MRNGLKLYFQRLGRRFHYWGDLRTWPPTTAVLLAINTGVFAYVAIRWGPSDLLALYRMGAYVNRDVWDGELWRLVTPLVLHYGWLHFLCNQVGLLMFGSEVERAIGSGPMLVVYMVSGLIASSASGAFPPEAISVGASGAIYGVAGIWICGMFGEVSEDQRYVLGRRLWGTLAMLMAFEAVFALVVNTDLAGHIGGLAAGVWFSALLLPPRHGRLLGALRSARIRRVFSQVPRNEAGPAGLWVCDLPVWERRLDTTKLLRLITGVALFGALFAYNLHPFANPSFQLHRIDRLAYAGQLTAARDGYRRWLAERDPDPASVRFKLAVVERLLGEPDVAAERLARLVVEGRELLRSEPMLFIMDFAHVLAELAQVEGGDRSLASLLERDVPSYDAFAGKYDGRFDEATLTNQYAWLLVSAGQRLEEAERLARRSVAADRNAANLDTLGWILHHLGRNQEAARELRASLTSEAGAGQRYHLGIVLAVLGQRQEAQSQLRQALALGRSDMTFTFADELGARQRLAALERQQHAAARPIARVPSSEGGGGAGGGWESQRRRVRRGR